ncbi:MAG: hypothetical protein ACFFDN_03225 [Candidatus Hodarchaeota archaeon]
MVLFKVVFNKSTMFLFSMMLLFFIIFTIHPFLAVNHPIKGDILVVEGWLPEYSLKEAIKEFYRGDYQFLVTTGGHYFNSTNFPDCSSYAERAAILLQDNGFDEKLIIVVPAPFKEKHNTFNSAIALRKWLMNSNKNVTSMNLFTIGVHARKSYYLFRKALNSQINVGVISSKPFDYNPNYWFFSIEGFKWIFQDGIGYIYALIYPFNINE